jgi:hypothetical protein
MAQTSGAEVVVVQTYYTNLTTLHLAITRANGQTEEVIVKGAGNVKDHVAAAAYQQVLAKLVQEGYTLKSTLAENAFSAATLIFERRL